MMDENLIKDIRQVYPSSILFNFALSISVIDRDLAELFELGLAVLDDCPKQIRDRSNSRFFKTIALQLLTTQA